jgi:hypothetical protein
MAAIQRNIQRDTEGGIVGNIPSFIEKTATSVKPT